MGVLGVAGADLRRAGAAEKPGAASITPYADGLEALRRTDPALVHFEEAKRVRCPRPAPRRILVDAGGRMVLLAGKHLVVMDAEGGKVWEMELGEEARSHATAPDGAVYVGLRDRILVLDGVGKKVSEWELPAKKCWLASLAAGNSDVFATDATARAVYRFDRSGKLLKRWGEKNSELKVPGFVVPSPYFDLELGKEETLWVVNPGRHQLEQYGFDGSLISTWGEPSFGIRGFCGCCNPSYFALMADGRFVTSEKGLNRVKVYSSGGVFESVVAGTEAFPKYAENASANPVPVDVAADASGRVLVADTMAGEIRVYRGKGKV